MRYFFRSLIFIFIFNFSYAIGTTQINIKTSDSFLKAKNKVLDFMLKGQRSLATEYLNEELKTTDQKLKIKLSDLKYDILNQFLTLKSQEFFEIAATNLLTDKKKSLDNIQKCLALEPDNIQCKWIELKYLRKYNLNQFNDKAKIYLNENSNNSKNLIQITFLDFELNNTKDFNSVLKNKIANLDDLISNSILKYNLEIQNEQFLEAKKTLNNFPASATDYPDLIFMKYQLGVLQNENQEPTAALEKEFEIYVKKCADLPANITRKYLFDIAMCARSLK